MEKAVFFVNLQVMEFQDRIGALNDLFRGSHRVVLITHIRPDGDAVGSQSALYHFLKIGSNIESLTAVHQAVPKTIDFICGDIPFVDPVDSEAAISAADLIVVTDMNELSRGGEIEPYVRRSTAAKVLIDHHMYPDSEAFDLVFSSPESSSACELLYYILKALPGVDGDVAKLPPDALSCLMAGMTTDTNNFANSATPSTFAMASELIAAGVDRDAIIEQLYNRYRENRLRAIAHILSNELFIREDGLAVLSVSAELWHSFGLEDGELEGLVNLPLSIDKVKLCIYLRESEDSTEVRVSIRAKRGYSANRIAKTCFNGGGHLLASGGKLKLPQDMEDFGAAIAFAKTIEL